MLRLFDEQGRDITNQPSQFCDNPNCLGEPWCSAWGICRGEKQTADDEEIDSLFFELSQRESCSTPTQPAQPLSSVEPHCSYTTSISPPPVKKKRLFAPIKSDKEVEEARATGVPSKTIQDTKYCMSLWESWVSYRESENEDSIGPIEELSKKELQHWLSRFILEVGSYDSLA